MTSSSPTDQAQLIQALMTGKGFPQPVAGVEHIETHISHVLLAGDFAYKIKKNVSFGFLDFSTLEKRKHCCEEELRLNRRQAPDLYLAVIPITGTPTAPQLNGNGDAIEYAVKMQRFSQQSLLDQRLAAGQVNNAHIDLLAQTLVAFHHGIAKADNNSPYGGLDQITRYTLENCRVISPLLTSQSDQEHLATYTSWIDRQHSVLAAVFAQRKRDGFIRECHGDLHLRNITLDNHLIHFFDCIEFNPDLRWVDVISELAFLAMDLDASGYLSFSRRLLNHYFEFTGDYAGVTLLRYYLAYRAMVRAKVAMLRLPQATSTQMQSTPQQQSAPEQQSTLKEQSTSKEQSALKEQSILKEQTALKNQCSDYLKLAWRYATERTPALILTHGLSGSGKSTHTAQLVELLGAIRLRSDVERKRLFGLAPTTMAQAEVDAGIYSHAATEKTYAYLVQQTRHILQAGFPVIIDATSLKRWQRNLFRELAQVQGVPFVIVDFAVERDELERRIRQRQLDANDPSDATLDVLRQQIASQEPLESDEYHDVFSFPTHNAHWQPLFQHLALTAGVLPVANLTDATLPS